MEISTKARGSFAPAHFGIHPDPKYAMVKGSLLFLDNCTELSVKRRMKRIQPNDIQFARNYPRLAAARAHPFKLQEDYSDCLITCVKLA